jgi:hypothetical protein
LGVNDLPSWVTNVAGRFALERDATCVCFTTFGLTDWPASDSRALLHAENDSVTNAPTARTNLDTDGPGEAGTDLELFDILFSPDHEPAHSRMHATALISALLSKNERTFGAAYCAWNALRSPP